MPKQKTSMGVYLIEDHTSGDTYVGSTTDLRNRWRNINNGKVQRVSMHLRANPTHAVSVRMIEFVSVRAALRAREQVYLDSLKPTLNLSVRSTCDYPKHGRGAMGEGHWKSTAVIAHSIKSGVRLFFPSLLKASAGTGVRFQNISAVIRGKQKTAKGYRFEYSKSCPQN